MPDTAQPDRWAEIDALFQEALDLGPGEWDAYLARRCPGDVELQEAVKGLLAADRGAGSFLEASAEALAPEDFREALEGSGAEPSPGWIGKTVGSFHIVRQLGRGGMAGVYLARRTDGEFDQRVAIKFIRRGLDTEDFIRRFLAERQILSSLDHPNIARLIDGGRTEGGLPYLALEFVDGLPITEYCRRGPCTIEQRLDLFLQVAQAVQYAHANLVVHRDIKPSNILVTAEGRVKLLDFGIAKLLDPDAGPTAEPLTRTGLRPLTPEYASPEQIRGEAITTASDVYQLGGLLYRLLTGERPHRDSAGASLEAAITTTRPKPPSEVVRHLGPGTSGGEGGRSAARLQRRLRGDLDTIVLKALRKDPARRYGTAQQMAEDVQRHLKGLPIAARRESRVYRAGKFLRRNAWVGPVSLIGAGLIAAYVATLIQHGNELEAERNVARDVQQAFVSFFTAPDSGDVGLGEGRRDLTILEAIRDGTDRVRQDLADRPAARAELFTAMATVLQDLDEPEEAYGLAAEALDIERGLYGEASEQVHETLLLVGQLSSDPDSGRAVLERRLELSHALYGPEAPAVATSLHALAALDLREGKLEDAVLRLETAIDILRADAATHPRRLAEALSELADNLEPLDRAEEAVAAAREGYDILAAEFGDRHSQSAIAGARLAQALTAAGRYPEARRLHESSLAVLDAELGPSHATTMSSRNNYAILLRLMGELAASESVYRTLLEGQRQRYGAVDAEIAASLQNLAVAVKDQGRLKEAERLSMQAHEMFEETRGADFFQTAFPLLTISEIRLALEDYAGAESVAREARTILAAALPPGHFATAIADCRIGQALAGQERTADARLFLEAGL
ncbi:MAG: serine/threonine-protein kinase, partial [Gemmatimonadota bacterium]|nr:serine/threonine-protein kinase [Gemmatimonadota bacterium]